VLERILNLLTLVEKQRVGAVKPVLFLYKRYRQAKKKHHCNLMIPM